MFGRLGGVDSDATTLDSTVFIFPNERKVCMSRWTCTRRVLILCLPAQCMRYANAASVPQLPLFRGLQLDIIFHMQSLEASHTGERKQGRMLVRRSFIQINGRFEFGFNL